MEGYSTYVGLDVHAETVSVCALAAGRDGEELFAGTIPATAEAISKLVAKVAKRGRAAFCYEAGPCGYGIQRQIAKAGHACDVIAPSLVPVKKGERVKTDKRDARKLARTLRAGELTAIWVPDSGHEAMRDLVRLRHQAVRSRVARQLRLSSFLLRQGRRFAKGRWTRKHWEWLRAQAFAEPAHQFVFRELCDAILDSQAQAMRAEQGMMALLPEWRLAPLVDALRSLRGIDVIGAATLACAIGDPRRFASAASLMAYFGLVPCEHTSGAKRRQGGITKTGDSEARRILVEAAWCHRSPPAPGLRKQAHAASQPQKIREIAKACEARLHQRTRALIGRGKRSTVIAAAVAREQAGFIWAIAREAPLIF